MAEDFTPISLDQTQPVQEQPISIDTGAQLNLLTPEVAASRASKATYGLTPDIVSKSYGEFYQRFVAGQEPQVRNEAAKSQDYIRALTLNNSIKNIATQRGE